ncbi:formimidoylglutamate deiminase [soil metagenome]
MRWHAAYAQLPGGLVSDVLIEAEDGRFTSIQAGVPRADLGHVERLPGVVLPGFANTHSHAFHRALRGRTHAGAGTFWTWREAMYALAQRLDPDRYMALARATYAEMALAGITSVGEFHYLHHQGGGRPYDHPNEMAHALTQAADDAGIRLTLLDTCYLAGGLTADNSTPTGRGSAGVGPGVAAGAIDSIDGPAWAVARHLPLSDQQRRFGDADVEAWAERVSALRDHTDGGPKHLRVGVAAHSVRAVPAADLPTIVDVARQRSDAPVHIHLSEQPAENEACTAAYGRSPTELLDHHGLLGPSIPALHATHLSELDIQLLGKAGATAAFCPTTERDLADGIGPARALHDAGARLALGTDQHAMIDMFEEIRGLEMHERLCSGQRGRLSLTDLLTTATRHTSIGWPDAGTITVGQRADLVAVRDDTVRTVGSDPAQILMSATAADVDTVVAGGTTVVSQGRHRLGDVATLMREALTAVTGDN